MAENAGTSDFCRLERRRFIAARRIGRCHEPRVGQGRVDFYILEDPSSAARLKLACRLAEKAYLAAQRCWCGTRILPSYASFDEMLWIFKDGSFVPHESARRTTASQQRSVLSC